MTQLVLTSFHYGIFLILLVFFIRYQVGKRRFNRRSTTGVQLFKSYFTGLLTTLLEALLNVIEWLNDWYNRPDIAPIGL
jgi:Co/Zn/Cd efflux system component